MSPPETPQTQAAEPALRELRMRLLDLRNSNRLLNFRHSERARTHVRVIDELPDVLMDKLVEGKSLAFKSLPEPEDEPEDEQNDDFLMALEQARQSDPDYLRAVAELDDDDPTSKRFQQVERALADRVRDSLGMPKRASLDIMSIAEFARHHGLEPSYDLPGPDSDGKDAAHHTDDELQTLLLPERMQRKLSGIHDHARSALQETGVHTHYAAFGFLEWYESADSDKSLLAPLLLHPVEMTRTLKGTAYRYAIFSTGEETEINLTLRERLARDFGLKLPDLEEDDTPEVYFEKVTEAISDHRRWRVRRFITVGHFAFARLVMYHDLAPERWPEAAPLHHHRGLAALLGGEGGDPDYASAEYDVDDPETARQVPLLVADADASQFSVVVDVMQGRNLAIKGPPGTGKSQTITNIIASALAKGQRVLFVAEKMAALEVVKSRFDSYGLGEFCLELHSTKARKKDMLASLQRRLELQHTVEPPEQLDRTMRELDEQRRRLTRYIDLVSRPCGRIGKSIQEVLWAAQRAQADQDIPATVDDVALDGAEDVTEVAADNARARLATVEEHARTFAADFGGPEHHPWRGVQKPAMSPFDQEDLLRAVADWSTALQQLHEAAAQLNTRAGSTVARSVADCWALVEGLAKLPEADDGVDSAVLAGLRTPEAVDALETLVVDIETHESAREPLANAAHDPAQLEGRAEDLEQLAQEVREHELESVSVAQLADCAQAQEQKADKCDRITELATRLCTAFGFNTSPTAAIVDRLMRATDLLADAERRTLLLRTPDVVDEANAESLREAAARAYELKERLDRAQERLNVPTDDPHAPEYLRTHAGKLRESGAFGFLRRTVREAKRAHKALSRRGSRRDKERMIDDLETVARLTEEIQAFNNDARLRDICGERFHGLHTNFIALKEVADFATRVRSTFVGADDTTRAARKTLLAATMEDIDVILALREDETWSDLGRTLETLGAGSSTPLKCLAPRLRAEADAARDVRKRSEVLGLRPETPLNGLDRLAEAARTAAAARQRVQAAADTRVILGTADAGVDTELEPIRRVLELARRIHDAELPGPLVDILVADYSAAATELADHRLRLEAHLHAVDDARDRAYAVGDIDADAFFAGAEPDTIESERARLQVALDNAGELESWSAWRQALADVEDASLTPVLEAYRTAGQPPQNLARAYDRVLYRALARHAYHRHGELATFSGVSQNRARERFQTLDRRTLELQRHKLRAQLANDSIPAGVGTGRRGEWTDRALIENEISKTRRHIPIRALMRRAGAALQAMKPCFMMSPLSVAQFLKPQELEFDLVVIDEASQMKPEDSLGAIARAKQAVVVGDPMQLPPTSFFDRMNMPSEDEEPEDQVDTEAILDLALSVWRPARGLRWHYRSRHASLIAFSNRHFYDDRLVVFPAPLENHPDYGVSLIPVEDGAYKGRVNVPEARAVADEAITYMHRHPERSLGIVALNQAQRDLLMDEMDRLFARHPEAEAYRAYWEEADGGLFPFFVKNLENVQGDERDAIFISATYGRDPETGRVMQRFGPINRQEVGHRRLNVLFTRARKHVKIFASMRPHEIRPDGVAWGVRVLRGYLEYARTGRLETGRPTGGEPDSDFEIFVADALRQHGYEVVAQVGVAGYRIDLAVRHPTQLSSFVLGIECDGATYHSAKSARDRDRLREEVLTALGWKIYRIWSTDWFANPSRELRRLLTHLEQTLAEAREEAPQAGPTIEDVNGTGGSDGQVPMTTDTATETQELDAKRPGSEVEGARGLQYEPLAAIIEVGDTVEYRGVERPDVVHRVTIVDRRSDPEANLTNRETPLAEALLDRQPGERATVHRPNGSMEIEILRIEKDTASTQDQIAEPWPKEKLNADNAGGPLPPHNPLEPYVEWSGGALPDPREADSGGVADALFDIISVEAPVLVTRAVRIYARACGYQRIGRQIGWVLDRGIATLRRRGQVTVEKELGDEVARVAGMAKVRLRERGSRTFEEIPASEVAEQLRQLKHELPACDTEDLYREVLTRYDLVRMTTRVRSRLDQIAGSFGLA